VRRRYNGLVARGESVVSPLERIGRSEAPPSRALIRQQVREEAVDELLIYLVEKSQMREMIVETSAQVGGMHWLKSAGAPPRSTARWITLSTIS
jgi:hypothetical protein